MITKRQGKRAFKRSSQFGGTNKMTNVFNFDDLDTKTAAEAGVEVEILKADGDTSGLWITVLGIDSSQYQKLRDKFDRIRVRQMAKAGKNAVDAIYSAAKDNDFELIAECTVGWRHESKDMPFDVTDKDKLVEFYKKYPLVYDQVRVAVNDRALFTKGSAKS